ncbi:arginase-1-like isoform X1 [Stegodyphus dumicola]|uniref:arginase-1-like isoform X1 n=1 Tax=Stegodyphus dumicola TaxID=202533 RepID=UPI0015AF26BE|nr:arginase-1-like isoform X1 [Stegodyphus dumicola]
MFARLFCQNLIYTQKIKICFRSISVGILGAPFSKGQPKQGVDQAPDAFRKFGLIKELQSLGLDVKDYGNVLFEDENELSTNDKLKFPLTVGAACKKVSNAVKEVLSDNKKCITLGGDHSLGIGTVYGHSLVHDMCILWIDAHADINTAHTTPTGNIHGMPCSFLITELQKYQNQIPGFEWIKPCVRKSNLAYIGLRDIDPFEKLILTKEEILHFTMRDIDKLGIFEVTHRALEAINPTGKLSLHVSFDIDSIDKLTTPSTGTPVIGGMTVREALCLAEEISRHGLLQVLDVVEVNPMMGSSEQVQNTLNVATLIIKTFMGYSRHGVVPRDIKEVPVGT